MPTRRQLLAAIWTLPAAGFAGCYAPRPEKLELGVPADAEAAVEATVTLEELPSEDQTFESIYTVDPGDRATVEAFEEGVDYRVTVAIDGAVGWRTEVRANQFYVLELRPDGSVTVVENGWYESTPTAA